MSLIGRYSVKCQVSDDGSAYVGLGFIGSANPLMLDDHGIFKHYSTKYSSSNNLLNAYQQKNHAGKPYYPSEQESGQDKMPTGNFNRVAAGGSFKVHTHFE